MRYLYGRESFKGGKSWMPAYAGMVQLCGFNYKCNYYLCKKNNIVLRGLS